MNKYTESLLVKLPKAEQKKVDELEPATDLIDNCKYLLKFKTPYAWQDYYCIPVKSIREAAQFVREATISDYELEIALSKIIADFDYIKWSCVEIPEEEEI